MIIIDITNYNRITMRLIYYLSVDYSFGYVMIR